MKTNNKCKLILLVLLNLTFLLTNPIKLMSQNQIFLTRNDLEAYELKRQSKIFWYGSDKQLRTAEEQEWNTLDTTTNNQYIYIQYYVFNSIPEAINGTAKLSQRFAVPYVWGSPTSFTIGEDTWSSLNTYVRNSCALFFVKENIGIQVYIHGLDKDQLMTKVTGKLVTKIEKSIQQNVVSEDKSNLIDSAIYKKFSLNFNYTNSISTLSHWVVDSSQYKPGWRKEWSNDIFTIGIDACLFNNVQEAIKAANMKSEICSISNHIYDLNDQNYFQLVKSEWDFYLNSQISNHTFSFIGYKGNIAFHVYAFKVDESKFSMISKIIDVMAK